jgi:hypothetical protein
MKDLKLLQKYWLIKPNINFFMKEGNQYSFPFVHVQSFSLDEKQGFILFLLLLTAYYATRSMETWKNKKDESIFLEKLNEFLD